MEENTKIYSSLKWCHAFTTNINKATYIDMTG